MVTDFQVIKKQFSTIYRVVDIDTGEVVFEREEDDANKLFTNGFEASKAYVTIRRQRLNDGRECTSVEQNGEIICVAWDKPYKRRRGGKKSYVKVYPDVILGLKEEVTIALLRLSPYIMVDGTLKDIKRRRYLSKSQALAALGYGRDKAQRIWREMIDGEILTYADHIIRLNRQYIARG